MAEEEAQEAPTRTLQELTSLQEKAQGEYEAAFQEMSRQNEIRRAKALEINKLQTEITAILLARKEKTK